MAGSLVRDALTNARASTGEKRRLVPPPPGWEDADDEDLALLAIQAIPAPPAPARRSRDLDTPPAPEA